MTAARSTMIIRDSIKEKKGNGMGWKERLVAFSLSFFLSFFLFSFFQPLAYPVHPVPSKNERKRNR